MNDAPLGETQRWFQVAVPNPDAKNIRVQLSAHIEEVAELLAEVHTNDFITLSLLTAALKNLTQLKDRLRQPVGCVYISFPDRQATLDGICDGLVTGTGLAHMLSMDAVGGLSEVNRSNFSKFDDDGMPIFNEIGKIVKGENYTPPDLKPYV